MSGDVGMDVALTDAERESLLCDCTEYDHPFAPDHDNACGITSNLWLELTPAMIQGRVERIIAARVEAAKAEALREAADAYTAQFGGSMGLLPDWLHDRAAALDPGPRA